MIKKIENFWVWDTNKLIETLRKGSPVNEGFYYVVFYLCFIAIPMISPPEETIHVSIMIIVDLLSLLIIYYLYLKNGGQYFIKSIVCLSVPTFFRYLGIIFVLLIICKISISDKNLYEKVGVFVQYLANVAAYIYLGFKMQIDRKSVV